MCVCVCIERAQASCTPHMVCVIRFWLCLAAQAWNEANYFLIKHCKEKKAIEHNEQSCYEETYDDNDNKHAINPQNIWIFCNKKCIFANNVGN